MANIFRSLSQLDRDYDALIEKLKTIIPNLTDDWNDFSDSDLGFFLIKAMAAVRDMQEYQFDRQKLEQYLSTVTERQNLISILQLIGYNLASYKASRIVIKTTDKTELQYGDVFRVKGSASGADLEFVYLGNTDDKKQAEDGGYLYTLYQGRLTYWPNKISSSVPFGSYTDYNGASVSNLLSLAEGSGRIALAISPEDLAVAIDGTLHFALPDPESTSGGMKRWDEDSDWTYVDNFVDGVSKGTLSDESGNPRIYRLYVDRDSKTYIQFYDATPLLNISGLGIGYLETEGSAGVVAVGTILEGTPKNGETIQCPVVEVYQGSDPESVEAARSNAVTESRTMGKAVTISDYESIISRFLQYDVASQVTNYSEFGVCVVDSYRNDNAGNHKITDEDFPTEPYKVAYYVVGRTGKSTTVEGAAGRVYEYTLMNNAGSEADSMRALASKLNSMRMVGIKLYEGFFPKEGSGSEQVAKKQLLRLVVKCTHSKYLMSSQKEAIAEALNKSFSAKGAYGRKVTLSDIYSVIISVVPDIGIKLGGGLTFGVIEQTGEAFGNPRDDEMGTVDINAHLNQAIVFGKLILTQGD